MDAEKRELPISIPCKQIGITPIDFCKEKATWSNGTKCMQESYKSVHLKPSNDACGVEHVIARHMRQLERAVHLEADPTRVCGILVGWVEQPSYRLVTRRSQNNPLWDTRTFEHFALSHASIFCRQCTFRAKIRSSCCDKLCFRKRGSCME